MTDPPKVQHNSGGTSRAKFNVNRTIDAHILSKHMQEDPRCVIHGMFDPVPLPPLLIYCPGIIATMKQKMIRERCPTLQINRHKRVQRSRVSKEG
jgi:hypothetical protein